jgi:hypothetical protein
MFTTGALLSRPEIYCFGAFLIFGVGAVLAVRNLKQFIMGCIALPIAGLCGGSTYLMAGLMYDGEAGILYGLATFAITGLIVLQILRWVSNLEGL